MASYGKKLEKLVQTYASPSSSGSSASAGAAAKPSGATIKVGSRLAALQEKYGTTVKTSVDDSYIQEFKRKFSGFASQYEEDLEKIGYFNSSGLSLKTQSSAQELLSQAETLRKYGNHGLDNLDGEAVTDYWAWLNDAERSLRDSVASISEIDRQYTEIRDFDSEAAQEEIQAMDLAIARLQQRLSGSRQAFARTGSTDFQNLATNYQAELKELQQQRSEKSSQANRMQYLQESYELAGVGDPASGSYDRDFKTYSQADSDVDDLVYRYINSDEDSRADIRTKVKANPTARQGRTAEIRSYDQMTEQEIGIYNYYYAKEGKDKAEQYLDSIQEQLNSRLAEERFERLEDNTALEMLFGAEAGLDQFASGARSLSDTDSGYIPPSSTQFASGMVREDLKDVGWKLPGGNTSLAQLAYDAVTTTANMAPSILASTFANAIVPGSGTIVGNATMFASAAGNAYQEALNRGYDKGQARAYSALIGGSEVALQSVLGGISALGGTGKWTAKMLDGIDNGLFRVAGKLGANMLSEGLEEGLQEVLTPVFQNLVLRAEEDVNWREVAYSALLGALTAGVMEAGGTFAADRAVSKTGQQVRDAGQVQRLQEIGSTMSADSAAYQLAGKVDGNTGAYTIGRLFNEVGATLTEQNQADIAASLERKGMDSTHAALHAEVMGYIADGGQLSDVQMKMIENNDVLAQTLQEVLIDPNSTVYQRQTGYNEMLRELSNQKAGTEPTSQAQAARSAAETSAPKQRQAVSQESQVRARAAQEAQADRAAAWLKESGAPVTIQSIASTEGGKLTFRTEGGETVSSADVELGSMGPVYEAVAGLEVSPGIANAIVAGYRLNPELTPEEYAMQAQNTFRFGKRGIPMKQVLASPAANLLESSTLESIYGLGRTYATDRTDTRQQKVQQSSGQSQTTGERGTVTAASPDVWRQMNQFQQEQYQVMTHIADVLGANIVLHTSQEAGWGNVNGRYDPDTDTIHLNIDAGMGGRGTMMFTLAHELTHRIHQWSPTKFKKLADFLMERYGEAGVSVEELIDRKLEVVRKTYEGQNLTEEQLHDRAFEEVVADSMEPMLTDGRVLQELKTAEPSIWEEIRSWVKEMAEKIRKAYARLKPDSAEGRAVLQMKDSIEEIEKLFLEGLQDSAQAAAGGQKNTAQEGGGQMAASVRYSYAGINAADADLKGLSKAMDMIDSGKHPEEVRKEEALRSEKEGLREDFDQTKAIFKLLDIREKEGIFTQGSIEAVAKTLKQNSGATGSTKELTGLLQEGFQSLAEMKNPSWADVETNLQPAVDWMMEHQKKYRDPRAQEALHDILTSKIYLDKAQKAEAAYLSGSYNDYRRQVGFRMFTDKGSISLDSQWKEWANDYPEFFDANATSTDIPRLLKDLIPRLRTMQTDMTFGIDAVGMEQDLLRQVYDGMIRAAVYPAQGQVLSWRDIRIQDLTREQAEQVQKIVQKHERQMQRLKKNHDAEMTGIRENFERQNAWRRESREKTELRHRIQRTVKQLSSMLTRETKTRHIPEVLKLAVVDALDAVNMDTVMAEERLRTLQEQLAITSDPDSRAEIEERIRTVTEMGGSLKKKLDSLSAAYAAIRADADPNLSYAFDEEIGNQIQRVKDFAGNTPLRNMSKAQLEAVNELYTAVMTRVRDMNKAFATSRQESIDGLGKAVIGQELALPQTDQRLSKLQPLRAFSWNNEKPVYAFERLGSSTLTELYNNVRKGEDVYAQDMSEARSFQTEMARRFHKKDWDTKKVFTFKDRLGKEFNLTLGQMMTLYAYSKRQQAWDHLQYGGFQFAPETQVLKRSKAGFEVAYDWTSAKTFKVDAQILGDIVSRLSPEQKEFADRMQSYLSDTMGAKGNEISMKLYGIRLFKERSYFPLKSSQAFLEQEKNKANGEVKIKNKGFTKQVQKYANNPVMLRSFDDIWADHVGEMSMYHGFTLPLEDFYRVRNYKEGIADNADLDEPTESRSVVSAIQGAHGKEAVQYIEQLLKDLNGGAVGDPRAAIGKSLTSKHKKAAVMASLSVIVQQPTSIFRAWAVVDPKYFGSDNLLIPTAIKTINAKQHKAAWAELKQYAPVAILKEMGSFDTNVGRSGRDYLNAPEYDSLSERTKAMITDSNYRDEVLGKAAAAADEMAWVAIWNAVKRETQAKNPGLLTNNREEFMRMAGERFTEVISKTQVYDSVLSRSSNMRSKDIYMNMATSFMAEPTVTANMVENAIRKWRQGDKKATGKIFAGVLASHVMNSMLVSVIYAMRDDDEDETFTEKYVSRLATELIDGMNPLTYIPFAKDIWSVFQGYDVDRADMSLVSDLATALKNREKLLGTDTADMDEEELQAYRKKVSNANWGLVDVLSSLFGIPAKNFRRDVQGIKNFLSTLSRGQKTTYKSLVDEVLSEVQYTLPGGKTGITSQDRLYGAIMAGDAAYVSRLKAGYKSESSYNSAVRKALRENDPRIRQAAEQRSSGQLSQYRSTVKEILSEKRFTQDDVVLAVNAEINSMSKGESSTAAFTKAKSLYSSDDFRIALIQGSGSMAKEIRTEIIRIDQVNGKTKEEAEKSFVSSARSAIKEGFLDGSLSAQKAQKALTEYCGASAEEAKADTQYWSFTRDHPDTYANDQWFDEYYEEVADSGIDLNTFMQYKNQVREITGEGKKARRMEVINALPITDEQKDALYFAEGWTDSRLYEAPWH